MNAFIFGWQDFFKFEIIVFHKRAKVWLFWTCIDKVLQQLYSCFQFLSINFKRIISNQNILRLWILSSILLEMKDFNFLEYQSIIENFSRPLSFFQFFLKLFYVISQNMMTVSEHGSIIGFLLFRWAIAFQEISVSR